MTDNRLYEELCKIREQYLCRDCTRRFTDCPNMKKGKKMPRYVDADKAYKVLTDYYHIRTEIQHKALEEAFSRVPTANVVSVPTYAQTMWERDVAIDQLKEIGKGFGEKMDDVETVVYCEQCQYGNDWNKNGIYTCNLHKLVQLRGDFFCADGVRIPK